MIIAWDKYFKNINVTDHLNSNVIKAQNPNKDPIQETLVLFYLPLMLCLYILFLLFQLAALYNIPPPPREKNAFYCSYLQPIL